MDQMGPHIHVVSPDVALKSLETYELIGFDTDTATKMWKSFVHAPEDDDAPDTEFLDYARFQIEHTGVRDIDSLSDDWEEAMKRIGINASLRSSIMMPEFEDLRATLPASTGSLKLSKFARQHIKKISGHQPSYKEESASAPAPASTAQGAPLALDRCTMIWRACSRSSAEEFTNTDPSYLNLNPMSSAPGDFSGYTRLASWTPQKETADRYATWLRYKVPIAEIAIIQVAIPETLIKSLSVAYLWSNGAPSEADRWRKIVWTSRRAQTIPRDLFDLERVDLWIGHIASGRYCNFVTMKDPSEIKDSDVLNINIDNTATKAIQWVFYTSHARDVFCKGCAGKVWVHGLGRLLGGKME
ncbi:predicted protein [Uncinocarpus reesii 1704]|uniref:Uncharacterized protein n=1 Tax=Uncinocarpus reesii (strain UAMH 1704) TaxID=336963 RepID=C4JEP0_UNCRE|nr:uncharacterized protein UREG_02200 [Uncinocarpus reesii 1704]EEP77351.1 predicted protein [Uncinocarpus reesii 1704]